MNLTNYMNQRLLEGSSDRVRHVETRQVDASKPRTVKPTARKSPAMLEDKSAICGCNHSLRLRDQYLDSEPTKPREPLDDFMLARTTIIPLNQARRRRSSNKSRAPTRPRSGSSSLLQFGPCLFWSYPDHRVSQERSRLIRRRPGRFRSQLVQPLIVVGSSLDIPCRA